MQVNKYLGVCFLFLLWVVVFFSQDFTVSSHAIVGVSSVISGVFTQFCIMGAPRSSLELVHTWAGITKCSLALLLCHQDVHSSPFGHAVHSNNSRENWYCSSAGHGWNHRGEAAAPGHPAGAAGPPHAGQPHQRHGGCWGQLSSCFMLSPAPSRALCLAVGQQFYS